MVRSICFDNGKEFAYHDQIASQIGSNTYFATPYHCSEHGSNENTNGLLRQYFPKAKSLNSVTEEQVLEAQNKMNQRPKKVLEYNTPEMIFRRH